MSHRRILVIQGEGGVAGGRQQRRRPQSARTHAPTRAPTHARGTRTIQKLDYRHPMSSKADFSASVNMLRGLSQIFFLLLLFGKLRPVSIEQNTFCFSHDMILNWPLLESLFGGEEVETNRCAHTLTRFGCTLRVSTTQTLRAPNICCRWARYWTPLGIFGGIYGQFNLFPAPLLSSLECSVSQPVIVGGIGVALSSGHPGNGLLCPRLRSPSTAVSRGEARGLMCRLELIWTPAHTDKLL